MLVEYVTVLGECLSPISSNYHMSRAQSGYERYRKKRTTKVVYRGNGLHRLYLHYRTESPGERYEADNGAAPG